MLLSLSYQHSLFHCNFFKGLSNLEIKHLPFIVALSQSELDNELHTS